MAKEEQRGILAYHAASGVPLITAFSLTQRACQKHINIAVIVMCYLDTFYDKRRASSSRPPFIHLQCWILLDGYVFAELRSEDKA